MTHPTIAFHLTVAQIFASQWFLMVVSYPALVATIAGIVLWVRRRHTSANKKGKQLLGPILTFSGLFGVLLPPALMVLLEVGAGWNYTSNVLTLNLRTEQGNIKIPLKGAKVQWINPNGGYALDGKINGTNSPFLNAGVFQLQNGDKANVLQYRSHPWLLIQYAGVNTLISTPNVTQLYSILHSVTPNQP